MQEKNGGNPCGVLFGIAFVALLVYIAFHFGQSLLEFLVVTGICLGATVLATALFVVISLVSNRLIRNSRYYSLRCYPVEMEPPAVLPIPADLPEAPGQETILPLYLRANLTNYGLRLAPHPPRPGWQWFPEDNAVRFHQLSSNQPSPLVIPTYGFYLYYRPISQYGNFALINRPADAPGFSGDLPDSWRNQALEVILIYTSICDPKRLNLNIPRANPLKLRLMVLDEKGQVDPAATVKFYRELWETKKPEKSSNDDDDSWMYRSRPTMPW